MDPSLSPVAAAGRVRPPDAKATFHRVLAATDGSVIADHALGEAIALAARSDAQLTVLTVLNVHAAVADMQMANEGLFERHLQGLRDEGRAILDRAGQQAAAAGVSARLVLREAKVGRAAEAIVEAASEGYDLVVIGTHGRRGLHHFMVGSEAEQVLRHAPVPVLVVRGEATGVPA
jgi:nucleotide-binding universal stress UspA family protein